ncbi:Abhydrolase 6 domain containing protein [Asbolus verrucosus]|uniref:Abhydrolase 6 domain containing protein n=1 Tax=Asbolus verrucosus TaxID=1661398 RepID=A0A482W6F5_ASBVE|nr:Abhydrolase 6 domain containing protein [Asbolus verrucosus]
MSDKTNGFHAKDDFEEIEIPVPWGQISGKWWGSKVRQPILAIHGWQDNAGTFDNLAPLLVSKGHSLLCIDLPGHGFSSHYSQGHYYYIFWDGIHVIRRLVKHFNWKRITIIGHSLGGGIAFLYAATYPEDIAKYVSFDIASPSVRCPKKMVSGMADCVDKFLKYENLTMEQMPCYTYEEMIDIVHAAYGGAVTKQSCEVMMKRGMKPAVHKKGHYVFTRDPRLKVAALGFMTPDQVMEFASRIRCEVLNIRGKPGMKFDFPEFYEEVLDTIGKQAKRLERRVVEGTHHLHLNNPERVIDILHEFLTS